MLPWQMNKILIFLIFPVFSGFSSLFTFLHFSLFLAYFGISLHIFVINFGKNFGKFQVCTKGKSAIGNRQVRNWGLRYILAFSHFSLIFIRSLWIDCFLKIFLCILKFNMSIGIHRNTDIRVSHNILKHLRIHSWLSHIRTKCMATHMWCNRRHLNLIYAIILFPNMLEILFPM